MGCESFGVLRRENLEFEFQNSVEKFCLLWWRGRNSRRSLTVVVVVVLVFVAGFADRGRQLRAVCFLLVAALFCSAAAAG